MRKSNQGLGTFNVDAAFSKEAAPLFKKLNELGQKHGVSMFAVACVSSNEHSHAARSMTFFNGEERTPDEFVIAKEFATGGMKVGLECLDKYKQHLLIGGLIDELSELIKSKGKDEAKTEVSSEPEKVAEAGNESELKSFLESLANGAWKSGGVLIIGGAGLPKGLAEALGSMFGQSDEDKPDASTTRPN